MRIETTTIKDRHGRAMTVVQVPSVAAMEDALDPSFPHDSNIQWHARTSTLPERAEFYGGISSVDEAKALLREGWPEGRERALELMGELDLTVPQATKLTRRLRYGDTGDEVAMGRYMSGQYDRAWRSMPRDEETAGQKIISVGIGFGANSSVRAEDMFWGTAAGAILVDRLEDAGFRVEVKAYSAHHGQYPGLRSTCLRVITAKRAEDPLLLDGLVAFAHAATYRFWGFLLAEAQTRQIDGGHGSNRPSGRFIADAVEGGVLEDEPDIFIERCYSREAAVQQVEQALLAVEELAGREVAR